MTGRSAAALAAREKNSPKKSPCASAAARRLMHVVAVLALLGAGCAAADSGTPATTAVPEVVATTTTLADAPTSTTAVSADGAGELAEDPSPDGAGLGDSFYPWMGNTGYDALHYVIELDVDPQANSLVGTTTISAIATERLEGFFLDLAGLEVTGVTVDGADATWSRLQNELMVVPAATIAAGAAFTTVVQTAGVPEPISDPGVPFTDVGWFNENGTIFTVSQPSGSMSWYPSNNHPIDKATFEFRVTVPEAMTVAASGVRISDTVQDGRRTAVWRMDDPMATYLAAVYIGDFERLDEPPGADSGNDRPLIRNYVHRSLTPVQRAEAEAALGATAEILEFFEERLGPYPFDAYGTIVVPLENGFALENQTLSIHDLSTLLAEIVAHEMAHQWFGNSVTLADWSDIWLHEGFATYLHLLYQFRESDSELESELGIAMEFIREEKSSAPGRIEVAELFDSGAVYVRGAFVLHALRLHAGDDAFWEIARRFHDENAGANASTEDFRALVSEVAGPDAVEVVDQWLYSAEMPLSFPDRSQ